MSRFFLAVGLHKGGLAPVQAFHNVSYGVPPGGTKPRPDWRDRKRQASFSAAWRSSPVSWSTTFMERRTLPRSSMPSTFT